MSAEMTYVVILNWNGWRDTVACLESALRCRGLPFQLVVCDNASTDGSLDRLLAWARGSEAGPPPDGAPDVAALAAPGSKPVPHALLSRAEAERGGGTACDGARVVFVQTGANLGYAGGCNVGLRYALARGDCAYAWLLNNDTVVAPDALAALVRRVAAEPNAGQCGSRVLYHDEPDVVQSWGGARYNRWLATMRRIGDGAPATEAPDVARVERDTDYVCGASVLVTRAFLDRVGLMADDYFLYFEELDWAIRGRAFRRVYAHDSVVYHREGRSIGSSRDWRQKSALSDYYGLRNRLRFTRRFFPHAAPTVYCGVVGAALNRLRRRQFGRAAMILRILLHRERGAPPPPSVRRPRVAPREVPESSPGSASPPL